MPRQWQQFLVLIHCLGAEQDEDWRLLFDEANGVRRAKARPTESTTPAKPASPAEVAASAAPGAPTKSTALATRRLLLAAAAIVVLVTSLVVAILTLNKERADSDEALPLHPPVPPGYSGAEPRQLTSARAPQPGTSTLLSLSDPAPTGWSVHAIIGWAYPAGEDAVPGLIPIYRYRCVGACDETPTYFPTIEAGAKQGFAFEQEAFRCFDRNRPPPDSRPLHRLMNKSHARTWAVPGTKAYREATAAGFADYGLLCYIW
jgi:hypothetical protein